MVLGFVEVDETTDEQIESAVIVIIEPDRAGSPSGGGDPCLLRYISEGAVTVVAVENAAPILGHVQVREAIGVVIADGDAHAITTTSNTGRFGDIGEGTVAVIAVERVAQRLRWSEDVAFPAIDEINVHPAVVVVVAKGASGARGLRKVFFRGQT